VKVLGYEMMKKQVDIPNAYVNAKLSTSNKNDAQQETIVMKIKLPSFDGNEEWKLTNEQVILDNALYGLQVSGNKWKMRRVENANW
jgi:hypothetical protein